MKLNDCPIVRVIYCEYGSNMFWNWQKSEGITISTSLQKLDIFPYVSISHRIDLYFSSRSS